MAECYGERDKPSLRGAEATKQSRVAGIERWIASLALAMTATSWPDLFRPSTSYFMLPFKQDVDARNRSARTRRNRFGLHMMMLAQSTFQKRAVLPLRTGRQLILDTAGRQHFTATKEFSTSILKGRLVNVSGQKKAQLPQDMKRIPGLQRALNFYALACTPQYEKDGKTPLRTGYQATMLEYAAHKLNDPRERMPEA